MVEIDVKLATDKQLVLIPKGESGLTFGVIGRLASKLSKIHVIYLTMSTDLFF